MKKGLLTGLHCNFNREEAICIEKSSKVCSLVMEEMLLLNALEMINGKHIYI